MFARVILFLLLISSSHTLLFAKDNKEKKSLPTYFTQPQFTGVLDKWWTVGTVSKLQTGQILVGDYIGYDGNDSDGDLNPQTIWYWGDPYANIGSDSDLIISQRGYQNSVVLKYSGCIPYTTVSYNWVALFEPNQNFTGAPSSAFTTNPFKSYALAFVTKWEQPDNLFLWRVLPGNIQEYIPIPVENKPVFTDAGFCAEYKIIRKNNLISAYINNIKISELPNNDNILLNAEVRTFDRPALINSITIKSKDKEDDEDD